ncbi:phosphoglycerate kinase [Methanobrevibacter cuticularis]|uniref:Phosphoglycerate kinase n=1 Tax=Methanobrevibacter cuticularis TaxID=47311 RepID=A0A166D4V0_9EURY|nr:phosphoglycerate kinase [Methanobrevibacter cuticularis]KZX15210.1 phosphoglycerate kinase [Methanobrevibacter cuticularis]
MSFKFNVIDDFDFKNKTVLIRIDINSPVDPNSGVILDDTRMKLHGETIKELSEKGAKTVILAHQSRPGKKDFTTLEQHSKVLSKNLNLEIKYIDSIFAHDAINSIKSLKNHEVLLLENVRFFSEESLSRTPKEQSKSILVKKLSPFIDFFINDAFAAAHRSQPSLVGFNGVIPSLAGRIMEKELKIIQNALENVKKPCVFILGGMKADDSIDVMENVLKNETADFILVTGLVANIILLSAGIDIGDLNVKFIKDKGHCKMVKKSKKLLKNYKNKIIYPKDVAIEDENGERVDVAIDKIPNRPIFDIGIESIKDYAKIIRNAKTIFANGPAGVFENPKFAMGTEDILNTIANSNGFSIIGGGHIAAAAVSMGFEKDMDHISSGGGACINLLAGKKLVSVEALEKSAKE